MADHTLGFSDRTRRAWDVLQGHLVANGPGEVTGWWVAIRMSDGGSDGNLYRSKEEAVRYQLHETQCAYICIPPDMNIREVDSFLRVNEMVYDAGGRLSDVDTHIVPTDSPIRRPV